MSRGNPGRIRLAQRAGFIARLASARNIDRVRAAAIVEGREAELVREGIRAASPGWCRDLERRAGLA